MLYNTESNNDFFCEPDNKFNPSEHASNKNLIYSMQFTCFLFFLADNNKAVKHSRNTPNNIDCHTARPHFPDLVPPKQCDKQILGNESENNLRINNVQTFPRNSSYATQGDEGFNVVHNQSYYK